MISGNFTKQPSLRELVMHQSKINLDIKARLANNDKTLEDIKWIVSHLPLMANLSIIKR